MSSIVLRIITLIPLLVGLYFASLGMKSHLAVFHQSDWATAQGKIVQSEVRNLQSKAKTRAKMRAVRLFQPYVAAEYQIAGASYTFETVGAGLRKREAADKVIENFQVGAPITIHYDPENPAASSIEKESSLTAYVLYAVGLFFGLLSWLLVRAVKSVPARS